MGNFEEKHPRVWMQYLYLVVWNSRGFVSYKCICEVDIFDVCGIFDCLNNE